MTAQNLTALIQSSIDNRELPFPVRASVFGGHAALTITVRNRDGEVQDLRSIFPIPTDLVLLDGMGPALYSIVTKGNEAQHQGMGVL